MKKYIVEYTWIQSEGNIEIKRELSQKELAALLNRDDVILKNVNKEPYSFKKCKKNR